MYIFVYYLLYTWTNGYTLNTPHHQGCSASHTCNYKYEFKENRPTQSIEKILNKAIDNQQPKHL